jgi:hypothetical protein
VNFENPTNVSTNAGDPARDENSESIAPVKPKLGSNASWPLIAYLGGMTIVLIVVAVLQVV